MTGSEMKAIRQSLELTQEGLGKHLGVSRATINILEAGEEKRIDQRTAMAVLYLQNAWNRGGQST